VSRDVVFDESVYPFAQLHQNTGARLHAELDLLPDILKNPSHDFGDAIVHNQCLINTDPANVALSPSGGSLSLGSKMAQNGAEIAQNRPYFMCSSRSALHDNNGAGIGVDSPAPRTTSVTGSPLGSVLDPASSAPVTDTMSTSTAPPGSAGSSAAAPGSSALTPEPESSA